MADTSKYTRLLEQATSQGASGRPVATLPPRVELEVRKLPADAGARGSAPSPSSNLADDVTGVPTRQPASEPPAKPFVTPPTVAPPAAASAEASPPGSPIGNERPGWSSRQYQRQQSAALTIVATLAVLHTLSAAQAILFPMTLAILFSLTLWPVVRALERRGISRLVTSIGLLLMVVCGGVASVSSLIEPAQTWVAEAPARMQVVGQKLSGVRDRLNELYSVSERLESIAAGKVADDPPGYWQRLKAVVQPTTGDDGDELRSTGEEPVAVELRQPRLIANLSVLNSAGNLLGMLAITLVLGFFLLWEGDMLLNNLLGTIPRFGDKKSAVRLVYSVERGISRYLLTVTLINVCLGVAIGVSMWLLGLPNPALWGLLGTVLNFIPYLGALLGVVIIFLVSVFSFDSLAYAILAPLVYFALTAVEGNLVTPALVGRSVSLNSVAVFTALVVWGWLWGIGGALIGVPLLIIFKLVCEQFERTAAIGALLEGRRGPV